MAATGHKKGLWAEARAALHLKLKGYSILAMRFKTPAGEIDIVARKGNVLIFVEVKLRRTEEDAAEAIHPKNRRRVADAALLYLQKHPEYNDFDMRFDALLLGQGGKINHVESAWGH